MARKPREGESLEDEILDGKRTLEENAELAKKMVDEVLAHTEGKYKDWNKKISDNLRKNLSPIEIAVEDLKTRLAEESSESKQSFKDNLITNLVNNTGKGRKFSTDKGDLTTKIIGAVSKFVSSTVSTYITKPITDAISEMSSAYENNFTNIAGRMGTDRSATHDLMHQAVKDLNDSTYGAAINANKELIPALSDAANKGFQGTKAIQVALSNSVDKKIMPWLDTTSATWAHLQFTLSDNEMKTLKAQQLLLQASESGNRLLQSGVINKIDSDLAPILSNIDYNTMDKEKLSAETKAIMQSLVEQGVSEDQAYAQAQEMVQLYRDPTKGFESGASVSDTLSAERLMNGGTLTDIADVRGQLAREASKLDIVGAGFYGKAVYGGAAANGGFRPEDYKQTGKAFENQKLKSLTAQYNEANSTDYDRAASEAEEKVTATAEYDNRIQNKTTEYTYWTNEHAHGPQMLEKIAGLLGGILAAVGTQAIGSLISKFAGGKIGKASKLFNKADDLGDAAKAASKVDDLGDAAKAAKTGKFGKILGKVKGTKAYTKTAEFASAGKNLVTKGWGKLATKVPVLGKIGDGVVGAAKTVATKGKGLASSAGGLVKKGISKVSTAGKGLIGKIVKSGADDAVEAGVKTAAKSGTKGAAKAGSKFVPFIGDALSMASGVNNVIRGFKKGGVSGTVGAIAGGVEAITGAVGAVADCIPGVGTAVSSICNAIGAGAGLIGDIANGVGGDAEKLKQENAKKAEEARKQELESKQAERKLAVDAKKQELEDVKKITGKSLATSYELNKVRETLVKQGIISETDALKLNQKALNALTKAQLDKKTLEEKEKSNDKFDKKADKLIKSTPNNLGSVLNSLSKKAVEEATAQNPNVAGNAQDITGTESGSNMTAAAFKVLTHISDNDGGENSDADKLLEQYRTKLKENNGLTINDVTGMWAGIEKLNKDYGNKYDSEINSAVSNYNLDSGDVKFESSEITKSKLLKAQEIANSILDANTTYSVTKTDATASKLSDLFQSLADLKLNADQKKVLDSSFDLKAIKKTLEKEGVKIPSYNVGIDWVPTDQLAMIHRGEAVIPADENLERLKNANSSSISRASNTNDDIITAISGQEKSTNQILREILAAIQQSNSSGMTYDKMRSASRVDSTLVNLIPTVSNHRAIYNT